MNADDDFWEAAGTLQEMPNMAELKKEADFQAEYDYDQDAEECAKAKHMCVVKPRPGQLQIDIDSEEDFKEHTRRYEEMCCDDGIFGHPHTYLVKPSANGLPHRHIYIEFDLFHLKTKGFANGFLEIQRIALQASLNDDPIRVYLNMRRWLNGIENPSRLFEKPQKEYETRNGLLYIRGETNDKNFLSACAGDAVARGYGFVYVENLIEFLVEHQDFQ
jgi:hypothetical protein